MTILKLHSRNRKVGPCATTYLPFRTCPPSCPFRHGECYAKGSVHVAALVRRISKELTRLSPLDKLGSLELVRAEAHEIVVASVEHELEGLPLRLHVSGDVQTGYEAELLAEAAHCWRGRSGGAVWSYTHSWRLIPVKTWGPISIWASVDNPEQGALAQEQGYPPALVVPHFDGRKAWDEEGVRWIACPAQTRGLTCNRCRICWNADKMLRSGRGVAFEAHGGAVGKEKALATTRVLLGEQLRLFD